MTAERVHHPKADKDQMYVNRSEGGRDLIQLETAYVTSHAELSINCVGLARGKLTNMEQYKLVDFLVGDSILLLLACTLKPVFL